MKIIDDAVKRGAKSLSEYESKLLLAEYGIPITGEAVVTTPDDAAAKASQIGYPVVLKGSGEAVIYR